MILPVLDYCDYIVDSGPVPRRRKMQTMQNRCLRVCLGIRDPRDISTDALHVLCSIVRLNERRRTHLLSLIFRLSKNADNVVVPVRAPRGNAKVRLRNVKWGQN